jgi:hypothetical protein
MEKKKKGAERKKEDECPHIPWLFSFFSTFLIFVDFLTLWGP